MLQHVHILELLDTVLEEIAKSLNFTNDKL